MIEFELMVEASFCKKGSGEGVSNQMLDIDISNPKFLCVYIMCLLLCFYEGKKGVATRKKCLVSKPFEGERREGRVICLRVGGLSVWLVMAAMACILYQSVKHYPHK